MCWDAWGNMGSERKRAGVCGSCMGRPHLYILWKRMQGQQERDRVGHMGEGGGGGIPCIYKCYIG